MSLGNFILVKNITASSLASNVQNEISDQLAKAREAKADNYGKQNSDSNQKAKAPNDINANIGFNRPRLPYSKDLIDISNITSTAAADSLQNQGQTQAAEVGSPKAPSYFGNHYGSAHNGSWQTQNSVQDVDSYNNIRARIDLPRMRRQPGAEIFVNKITSTATGSNVQVQDLVQDALVKKTPAPRPYCPPLRHGGSATNVADQVQNSRQDIDSKNYIDVRENIGGRPMPRRVDPSVTNIASTALGDNIQAQSAAQTALDAARSTGGTHAGNRFWGSQSSDQDVDSANVVNITVNDRVNAAQEIIAKKIDSTAVATNLQDSSLTQSAESAYRGSASNSGVQGQWSGQDANSGNWINTRM